MRLLLISLTALLLAAPSSAQEIRTADNIYVGDGLVYYSLTEGKVVPAEDKTGTNWDIMINGIEMHPNRAGLLLEESFDVVEEAPLEGMKRGAMKAGSGETWYNYDMSTHVVSAKPERTFVLMLADDSYAKLEIQSYYHRITGAPRYLSFRYQIADDGGRTFSEAESGR